ncbi:MAG: septum formation family protein [Actinomycetales bacterium]
MRKRTFASGLATSLATAGVVLALLGGILLAPPAAASEAPSVGTCYGYSAKEAKEFSTTSGPVDCAGPHTAEVFAVGTAPATMSDPRSAKPGQIIAATKSSCTQAGLKAYLGLTDDFPTRFQFKAHFPNAEQWAAGQRWVRCDATLRDQLALGTWAGTAAATVQAQGAAAFRFCTPSVGLLEAPDATRTRAQNCTDPKKQWILVATQALGLSGAKFPGLTRLQKKATAICKRYRNVYHGGLKDDFTRGWYYFIPTSVGWKAGDREVKCWVPLQQFQNTPVG